MQADTALNV